MLASNVDSNGLQFITFAEHKRLYRFFQLNCIVTTVLSFLFEFYIYNTITAFLSQLSILWVTDTLGARKL